MLCSSCCFIYVFVCVGMYQNKVSAGKVCTPTATHTYCRSNEIWHHGNIYQRWAFSYNAGAFWHNRCNETAAVAEMCMRVFVREDTCPLRKVWVQHVIFKLQAKALLSYLVKSSSFSPKKIDAAFVEAFMSNRHRWWSHYELKHKAKRMANCVSVSNQFHPSCKL